jgi:hypothetical protein
MHAHKANYSKKKLQFARGFEQLRNSIVFDTLGALKDKPKDRTM